MNFKIYIALSILFTTACEDVLLKENTTANPEYNFDVLWSEFDLNYSYFKLKNINWDSVYSVYRPIINQDTKEVELFDIFRQMSILLQDGHVSITSPFAHATYKFPDSSAPTINWLGDESVSSYLENVMRPTNALKYGWVKNKNIGYVGISSFGFPLSDYGYIDNIIEELALTKGIIIDLRMNGGGSDRNYKKIVSRFVDKKRLHRKIRYRNGPNRDDFSDWEDDFIDPSGNQYLNTVVVLTNEFCFSSTESCVLAFQVLPHAFVVGDRTRGGSGNPIQRELPNGWLYQLSNWQEVNVQMEYHEGVGIEPDLLIWITKQDSINGVDRILESAIEIIELQ